MPSVTYEVDRMVLVKTGTICNHCGKENTYPAQIWSNPFQRISSDKVMSYIIGEYDNTGKFWGESTILETSIKGYVDENQEA